MNTVLNLSLHTKSARLVSGLLKTRIVVTGLCILMVSSKSSCVFCPNRIIVCKIGLSKFRMAPLHVPFHLCFYFVYVTGVGLIISGILVDFVMFERKFRKSSKKLETKIMLSLCAFPLKVVNFVTQLCKAMCSFPFNKIKKLGKYLVHFFILLLKFTLDIGYFFLGFTYLIIESFLC